MTLKEKIIRALELEGETRVTTTRVSRYAVYSRKEGGYYYVGSKGELRVGHTSSVSIPYDKTKARLLAKHAHVGGW